MSLKLNSPTGLRPFLFFIALAFAAAGFIPTQTCAQKQTDYGEIALRVSNMLAEEHYLRKAFDDEMSERLLDNFLEYLDYTRVYFTQKDIDRFYTEYKTTLDDAVRHRDINAAYDIYGVYEERVRSRVDLVKKLLENKDKEFTFDSDRSVMLRRKKADWPADEAASDQLWHDLIEGEVLQETLREKAAAKAEEKRKKEALEKVRPLDNPDADEADKPKETNPDVAKNDGKKKKKTPTEIILSRYDRILESVNENDTEDIAVMFIKSLSRAYDPHSEYFSQQQYDNFRIQMNKKLTGIGAMLSTEEDGSAAIQGLVIGGPAHKAGELQVADKIVGVGQEDEEEIVDIVGMKLNDIVDLIRGKEGSIVRLKLIPANSDGSETETIEIVRDKVDLKDSLATADLILTRDSKGNPLKIGWINLLSFYSDMDGGKTSTTADVQRLVNRLMDEGIQGLVVDLRDNGGGSLEEAINMTGLFIPRGPVVQSLDWRGNRDYKASRHKNALWDGPMIVLTNRSSASASEIFAAALQDYNRAVIIGEKATFGKGTVQQLRPVQTQRLLLPFQPGNPMNGALKLTIQTFFRINGYSTQLMGVIPDIHLPSTNNVLEIGESALRNPLAVDPIQAENFELVHPSLPIKELAQEVETRIAENQEFQYIQEDIKDAQERIEKNTVSINRAQREEETKKLEQRREARKKERIDRFASIREEEKDLFTVYTLTQDNVHKEGLTLKTDLSLEESSGMMTAKKEDDPDIKALEYPHGFDPYQRETIHVIRDLIAIDQANNPVDISETTNSGKKAGGG